MPDTEPELSPGDDLLVDVRKWLERNGYRLELVAARSIMKRDPLQVSQGWQYVDPTTNKLRESDVSGTWAVFEKGSWHFIHLVVECKNTQAPWVLFQGDDDEGYAQPPLSGGEISDCPACEAVGESISQTLGSVGNGGYAIVEKGNPEKGSGQSRDLARDALLSVVSASVARKTEWEALRGSEHLGERHHRMDCVVSVVLTTSPIVRCTLGPDGEIQLEEIDRATLATSLRAEDPVVPVVVVKPDAFEQFLDQMYANLAAPEPDRLLRRARLDPVTFGDAARLYETGQE